MPEFLKSKTALWVSALLLLNTVVLYSSIRREFIPSAPPLSLFPNDIASWRGVKDFPIEPEVQEVLQADDTLSRVYMRNRRELSLLVAAFRSQRNGKAPHSPKNCLPGAGWLPVSSSEINVDVGSNRVIPVNRYLISHGNDQSLVLYWYQSRNRAVADEFKAKFWVMVDAMRLNRTDTALIRVIVPIGSSADPAPEKDALDFVKTFYSSLLNYLPA